MGWMHTGRRFAEAPAGRLSVKVFGQPRSGTNAIERLLRELGCDARRNVGGWKHGEARLCADRVVVVEKDPWAWAASMKRHSPETVAPTWGIDGWVERENAYRAFVAANPGRAALVTHDEMLDDWDALVERLARLVGHADPEHATVEREGRAMDTSGVPEDGRLFDPGYYIERRYLDDLSPREVRDIRAALAGEVARAYGDWFSRGGCP